MVLWRVLAMVVAVVLVAIYAIGSGRYVTTGSSWYLSLQQPAWQPPGAVFGLAWSYNFVALAVVGVAMSLAAPAGRVMLFLGCLGVTIALAITWSYLFYVPHALVGAAVVLTACAALTVVPVVLAFAERAWLGWVLVPYLVWLAVATSLSWGYVVLAQTPS
jgi:tryptophan-rich sensory protein